ncbi:hypothetical protein CkaCkLH20_07266 [Colletotrichum karsti]|uniref:Baeyer-Villiger monooxygenase n=1 Tax=Colletotrichum karsti TaxID=1095194 RepID=A0A9P6LJQ9_9PEZI|nr:uncharacterized protein CkaCkLH20_07266 [Colletotrichum karsti]KAF9875446.1 hypothetical protein CkaCkLH20_07266 [Colletotrichum karsti]
MAFSREGFTVDVIARWMKKSVLNPFLSIPFAAYLALASSKSFGSAGLPGLRADSIQRLVYLTALAGFVLSTTEYLNKWSANNWTTDNTWDWDKEIIVVTGGSGGIGASIIKHILARNPNATIVVVDLAPLSWEPPRGSRVHYFKCDLTDTAALKTLCTLIRTQVGDPTVLINNAGIARGVTIMEGSYADVELTIKTNLIAPFLLTKEFLPYMVRRNHGHIVSIGSMSSVVPPVRIADYSATKAGLTAMHESLQLELKYIHKALKVRQTLGIFGFIRTPLVQFNPGQPHFVMPLLHVDTVGEAIVDGLYSGCGGTIYLPRIMSLVTALRAGPEWIWRLARETTASAKDIPFTPRQKIDEKTGLFDLGEANKVEVNGVNGGGFYSQFACVGTGFSGIGLGATLRRWYNIGDIRFFERNDDLGGTWLVNQYPGCACDIPSALYSFSFESNPDWSRVMPPHDELWRYLDRVARKYSLRDKMTFGVNVQQCEWSEARQRWLLTIRRSKDNSVFTHECQFLFTATGQLMQPRPLDIPGSERFKGYITHSSRWDKNVDITGKRVVVFGNGCTASQIVPAIVGSAKRVVQVIKTKHWVLPSVDSANTNFMKTVFRKIPGTMKIQRFLIFAFAEDNLRGFYMTESGTRYRKRAQAQAERYMRETAPAKYHDKLIPDFELGCKRRIFDSGYLKSLHSENFDLVDDPVLEIVSQGIRTKDGVIEAGIIVVANGFVTNNAVGGLKVIGRSGNTIDQHWESMGGPEAYNCTVLSDFPNFFCLLGPNSLTGHNSAIIAAENCINYSLRIIRPLLEGKGTIVEVKRDSEQEYVNQMQKDMQNTVWFTGCNSWYLRGSKEGRKWNGSTYPYSQVYLWYRCLFPKFDDLEIRGPSHPSQVRRRTWRKPALLAVMGYIMSIVLGVNRNPVTNNRYWLQLRVIVQLLRAMLIMKLRKLIGGKE